MKRAKPDYYDPKLKGRDDGRDMENLPPITTSPPKTSQFNETDRKTTQATKQKANKPVVPPTNQSTSQSIDRLAYQSTNQHFDLSTVVGRPKAFYITQKQDEDLDEAVEKLNKKIGERINQKIDRSTVVRLVLEEANLTNEQTLAKLVKRLAGRLISQLTG